MERVPEAVVGAALACDSYVQEFMAAPTVSRRLRWKWWRLKTWARLQSRATRMSVRQMFLTDPHLHSARTNNCYASMAAFYNDTTVQGFMTEAEARFICNE